MWCSITINVYTVIFVPMAYSVWSYTNIWPTVFTGLWVCMNLIDALFTVLVKFGFYFITRRPEDDLPDWGEATEGTSKNKKMLGETRVRCWSKTADPPSPQTHGRSDARKCCRRLQQDANTKRRSNIKNNNSPMRHIYTTVHKLSTSKYTSRQCINIVTVTSQNVTFYVLPYRLPPKVKRQQAILFVPLSLWVCLWLSVLFSKYLLHH